MTVMSLPTTPTPTIAGLREAMKPPSTTAPLAPRPATVPAAISTPPQPTTPTTAGLAAVGAAGAAAANRPQLPPGLFETFANMVYQLSGMRFEANKSYFLASKIDNRMQALGIKTFEEYLRYIESPSGRTESAFLVDEVTINETFFYRHEPQLQAFITEVLNPMVQARRTQGRNKIRIWSAAASTGDELYTNALIIKEQGHLGKDMQFELVGTDISHEALKKARDGIYRKYNIRNVPPAVLQQNFTINATEDHYALKQEIKSLCRFQEMNLMDNARTTSLGKFDIIFVRNVLIYFDEKSKEQVVKNLVDNLADDGVVIMGHSENIYGQRHLLRPDKARTGSLAHIKAPPGTEKLNV